MPIKGLSQPIIEKKCNSITIPWYDRNSEMENWIKQNRENLMIIHGTYIFKSDLDATIFKLKFNL